MLHYKYVYQFENNLKYDFYSYEVGQKWNVMDHTCKYTTDAYGTLEFQGTGEGDKSRVCFSLYKLLYYKIFIYIYYFFYDIQFY